MENTDKMDIYIFENKDVGNHKKVLEKGEKRDSKRTIDQLG